MTWEIVKSPNASCPGLSVTLARTGKGGRIVHFTWIDPPEWFRAGEFITLSVGLGEHDGLVMLAAGGSVLLKGSPRKSRFVIGAWKGVEVEKCDRQLAEIVDFGDDHAVVRLPWANAQSDDGAKAAPPPPTPPVKLAEVVVPPQPQAPPAPPAHTDQVDVIENEDDNQPRHRIVTSQQAIAFGKRIGVKGPPLNLKAINHLMIKHCKPVLIIEDSS